MATCTLWGAGFLPLVAPFAALAVTTKHALVEVSYLGVGGCQLGREFLLTLGALLFAVVQQRSVTVLVPLGAIDSACVQVLQTVTVTDELDVVLLGECDAFHGKRCAQSFTSIWIALQ